LNSVKRQAINQSVNQSIVAVFCVSGTTMNLLKFPIINPKPTVLQWRVRRLHEQKTMLAEEEQLRRKQFRDTRSTKHATLMGILRKKKKTFF